MRPIDSLHTKLGLLDGLSHPLMHKFFSDWANASKASRYAMPSKQIHGVEVPWTGHEIANGMANSLRVSETYFVGKDVTEALLQVAPLMPPEVLQKEDLPSTHGFLMFEEPIQIESTTTSAPAAGLMWFSEMVGKASTGQLYGMVIWTLSRTSDHAAWAEAATVPEQYRGTWAKASKTELAGLLEKVAKLGLVISPSMVFSVGFNNFAFDMADRPGTLIANPDTLDIVQSNGDGTWKVTGFAGRDEVTGEPIDEEFTERVRPEPLVMFLTALWRFMEQELAPVERMHTPKTMARHLARRQLSMAPVSIIHLRRRAQGPESGDREFEYSHRWTVRGHWRRQWYASEGRHKSIYIAPHIKGPENAPFLIRERVTAVVR